LPSTNVVFLSPGSGVFTISSSNSTYAVSPPSSSPDPPLFPSANSLLSPSGQQIHFRRLPNGKHCPPGVPVGKFDVHCGTVISLGGPLLPASKFYSRSRRWFWLRQHRSTRTTRANRNSHGAANLFDNPATPSWWNACNK
jgi:hypothetical protein